MNVFSNNIFYTTIKVRQMKILQDMTAYQKDAQKHRIHPEM